MRPDRIIVHCSATPEGGWYTAADIDRWHKKRGWRGIGYHKVVLLDGTVEDGRPEDQQGAHVAGHNKDTLAVCYIGGMDVRNKVPQDTRTTAQHFALRGVVKRWMSKHDIPANNVLGHYELDGRKACPSFEMDPFRETLEESLFEDDNFDDQHLSHADLPLIGGSYAKAGIIKLQRLLGVQDDGWIGPETYRAIAEMKTEE